MSFNQKVYELVARIPKGRVSTYKIVAEKLGTKAYRAVGQAMNKNPHWPRVPCHRVVGTDGGIGGFAQGTKKKIALLSRERIFLKNGKIVDFKKKLYRF